MIALFPNYQKNLVSFINKENLKFNSDMEYTSLTDYNVSIATNLKTDLQIGKIEN